MTLSKNNELVSDVSSQENWVTVGVYDEEATQKYFDRISKVNFPPNEPMKLDMSPEAGLSVEQMRKILGISDGK